MSYQPSPDRPVPGGPVPTFHVPPPPSPPPAPAVALGRRRTWLVWFGVLVLVAGVGTGVAFFVVSSKAVGDSVKKFARAPVGCTTTLQFEKKATFTLYVETKGVAADVGGDCKGNGGSYDRTSATPPTISLQLVDSNGTPVTLTDSNRYSYDTGDYKGAAVQEVAIGEPGSYRLTVSSADTDFAIAIGGDPNVDARRMKYIGAAAIAGGLLVGLVLVLVGLRRRRPDGPGQATVPVPPVNTYGPTGAPVPFQVPTTPMNPVRPPGSPLPPPPPPSMPR